MSASTEAAAPLPPAPTQGFLVSNLLLCSMLWASGFLFIKLSGDVNPFVLAAMRGLVGATALSAWFLAQGKGLLPQGPEWRTWVFLGAFNGWMPNVLVAYALTQITTASAAMIQAASPLIVAGLSHLLFAEERLTPRRLVGVLVGFAGMGILIGPAALPDSHISPSGALAMVGVAVSYATANLYVRTVRHAEPARLALGQQICSGLPPRPWRSRWPARPPSRRCPRGWRRSWRWASCRRPCRS
jgi:drug/metabolite transporter (DMT)-like permease